MFNKKAHPLMSPSPWPRRANENVYDDFEFWQDNTNWPDGCHFMTGDCPHPEWFEHAYWLSSGEKTEMDNEWVKVYVATYGGIMCNISTAGASTGFYAVKRGRYAPSQVTAGRTTNTVDFSTKYNAIRGVLWDYWTNTNSSDQHNLLIGERPTAGTTNHGSIYISCDRNYSNQWRIWGADGDGVAIGPTYLAGAVNVAGDSCALQWEFVKGSHITLKMYINVNASLNFSTFTMPTWPIAETGNYAKIDMSTGNKAKITPVSLCYTSASAVEASNGRFARLAYEYRAIGNSNWKYLV